MDTAFDATHAHVGSDKLNVAVCLEGSAEVTKNALIVRLGGAAEKDAEFGTSELPPPIFAATEFELGRLWLGN
jgi:hypothetical protein